MFPIDISGSIRLRDLGNPASFVTRVSERLVDMLDEAGVTEVWPGEDTVRFKTASFWTGGRGGILAYFDAGTLRIETEDTSLRIRYRLSTVRMLFVITALSIVFFGFLALSDAGRGSDWRDAVMTAGFGWLWVFGLNYVFGMIRFPLRLERELQDVAK